MEENNLSNIPHMPEESADTLSGLMALTQAQNESMLLNTAEKMTELMLAYKELRMTYACAIKEVRTKLEVLDAEMNIRNQRNPISSITSRLKSNQSLIEKLYRKNLTFTLPNIRKYIQDIAGIRVICSYKDDIYRLADALLHQDDITLIEQKDYIATPKSNGYRSLHLIISVPVFFSEEKQDIPVEVQIRTIAMDFWASLEHQMKYKQDIPRQDETIAQLQACAQRIAELDEEMLQIRKKIDAGKGKPSQEDILLEKVRKLEEPMM